jgi:hypothetical protein
MQVWRGVAFLQRWGAAAFLSRRCRVVVGEGQG